MINIPHTVKVVWELIETEGQDNLWTEKLFGDLTLCNKCKDDGFSVKFINNSTTTNYLHVSLKERKI